MAGDGLHLRGLIPAVVTPFDARGAIDVHAFGSYLERLVAEGVSGLAVNMDTGEGPALTREERDTTVAVARDAAAGQVPVLAGVGAASTEQACTFAAAATRAGADAVVVFPNPVFGGDPGTVVPYHAAVGAAAGVPVVLFQLQPELGGVVFDEATLTSLCSLDGVIALKEASFDALTFTRTRELLRGSGVTLLSGNDNFVFESLVLGAEGSLVGLGSVLAPAQVRLHELVEGAGYAEAAELARETVQPLADLLFAAPIGRYRARVKCALTHLGLIPCADVRAPLLGLDDDEASAVRAGLEALR